VSTVPLADLLLSKLQVWEINTKDLGDPLCLLADHRLSEDDSDAEAIGLPRIAEVLGADWGFCHTTERNLGKLAGQWGGRADPGSGSGCPRPDRAAADGDQRGAQDPRLADAQPHRRADPLVPDTRRGGPLGSP